MESGDFIYYSLEKNEEILVPDFKYTVQKVLFREDNPSEFITILEDGKLATFISNISHYKTPIDI